MPSPIAIVVKGCAATPEEAGNKIVLSWVEPAYSTTLLNAVNVPLLVFSVFKKIPLLLITGESWLRMYLFNSLISFLDKPALAGIPVSLALCLKYLS